MLLDKAFLFDKYDCIVAIVDEKDVTTYTRGCSRKLLWSFVNGNYVNPRTREVFNSTTHNKTGHLSFKMLHYIMQNRESLDCSIR